MSRDQRAVQSSAWRRRVEGLTCARQVQRKTGERLPGLYWQFGHIHLQLLGSARTVNSVVVVPTSTDPMGILKSTQEFKTPGAGKEHTSAVRGGGRDPGVRRPGSGLGRPTARFPRPLYSCTHTVSAVSTRRALSFWIIPVRPMTPT